MRRWIWLCLLSAACGVLDDPGDGRVIITDTVFMHLEQLPLERMGARLDSVVIFTAAPLPVQAGDTLTLEAEVFWREGREPDVFMLVWNLDSCARGQAAQCRIESEYISVDLSTGHVRALQDVPKDMAYSVTVGIAVATRRPDDAVS
jgi:hypothetical protein